MVGGRFLMALTLLCGGVMAGGAAAQGVVPALPEQRIIMEPGVDFYGSDLRSIFGTTLPICRDSCLADSACNAFTFNTGVNACFLKTDDGARTPFPTALSATLAPQPEGAAARALARAAELGFLPQARLAAAREAALSIAFPPANPVAEPAVAADLASLRDEINRSDSTAAWALLAGYGASAPVDDWTQRTALRQLAVAAGINAFLRAGTDAEAGEAARLVGVALEADGEGRASLAALRLAETLAPAPAIAAAVVRAEGLFGFPRARPPGRFRGGEPAGLLQLLRPRWSRRASTTPTSCGSTRAATRSRQATRSSASTASTMAAATK